MYNYCLTTALTNDRLIVPMATGERDLLATESQRKANKKYFAENYSQVKLAMPKEEAAALRDYCKAHSLTVAGFIRGLIRDKIAADSAADPGQRSEGVPEGEL